VPPPPLSSSPPSSTQVPISSQSTGAGHAIAELRRRYEQLAPLAKAEKLKSLLSQGEQALADGHGAEALDRGPVVRGEVRIADRNYGTGPAIGRQVEAAGAVILRLRWQALRLATEDGRRFDLATHLAMLPEAPAVSEVTLLVATDRGLPGLPLRLVIQRKPPAAVEAEQQRLHRGAQRRQKRLDPRSLLAAKFLVLATTLPATECPAAEVVAAYRLRWQIELAFKRLKSLLHIDRLRARTAAGARSWLYAHLLLALLDDDVTQDFLESFP
jgi:hypothetical protein